MKIQVLGSGAGGGFPQWNCNCSNCYGIRNGKINATPRSQSSIAVSTDNENWVLFNASPDIRFQLEHFPEIHPRKGLRDTGIKGVVLVDSQIDHSSGLLILREGCPINVYTTNMVLNDLTTGFPIFNMLTHWNGGMNWKKIALDGMPFNIEGIDNLQITAVVLSGKAPPYSPHRHDPHPGDNIGLFVEDLKSGGSLFYAPGLGRIDAGLEKYFSESDCLLVDGTFWKEDEMIKAGVGTQMAEEMGHLPQSGEHGMIEALRGYSARKVLIHINNTNPILVENSAERHILRDEGIEVAYDGMVIELGEKSSRYGELLKVVP
jgi:pyrroloquinoline quinone biosynthesis protein B